MSLSVLYVWNCIGSKCHRSAPPPHHSRPGQDQPTNQPNNEHYYQQTSPPLSTIFGGIIFACLIEGEADCCMHVGELPAQASLKTAFNNKFHYNFLLYGFSFSRSSSTYRVVPDTAAAATVVVGNNLIYDSNNGN